MRRNLLRPRPESHGDSRPEDGPVGLHVKRFGGPSRSLDDHAGGAQTPRSGPFAAPARPLLRLPRPNPFTRFIAGGLRRTTGSLVFAVFSGFVRSWPVP